MKNNNTIEISISDRLVNTIQIINIIIIIIGLIGHILTIFVFSKRKFLINPSNIFLLYLAFIDALILILYSFEELLINKSLFSLINIKISLISCILLVYLKYALRSISSFIVLTFTIHRLLVVSYPLEQKYQSKKTAWHLVKLITITSLILNGWLPFFMEKNETEFNSCSVKLNLFILYSYIILFNISLTILLPIIIIIIINTMIILKIKANNNNNNNLTKNKSNLLKNKLEKKRKNIQKLSNYDYYLRIKPIYLNSCQMVQKLTINNNNNNSSKKISKKLTKTLLIISFSYVFLNLPYFLIRFSLTLSVIFSFNYDSIYVFSALYISQILFFLNYSIHFYIYLLCGSFFSNQLKFGKFPFFFVSIN
jgi:hypothetical protein